MQEIKYNIKMTYSFFKKTISAFLLFFVTACMFAHSALAATTLDLVTDRIMGDDEAMKTFLKNTESDVSQEVYLAELKKVELRLLESEKLYKAYKLDKIDQEIEPEVKAITNALIQTRVGVQSLQQGILQNNEQMIKDSYSSLTNSSSIIDENFTKIQQKAKKAEQSGSIVEMLYIALTAFFAIITLSLFLKRRAINKEQQPLKFVAIDQLFKQSLYPLVGAMITLGSLEYTKMTGGRTYVITWGLMLIGFLYFLKALFHYYRTERKIILEEEKSLANSK